MDLANFAIKTAKKAGTLAQKLQKQTLKIDLKGKNDLITNADKASEKLIIQEIKKNFPNHAILAEEQNFKQSNKNDSNIFNSEYIWIIDPIDGTTNYAHKQNQYCVSIGVFKTKTQKASKNFKYLAGEMIIGVIYAPNYKEMFYAEKNKGAFLNNKKIQVSKTNKLENSLLVTGFPPTHRKMNVPYFTKMLNHCQEIRRFGSAALDLAYIADGRFDGFWEFGLKPWDIAAGILIVKEAGGKITDTNGNTIDLFGQDILATNKKIHAQTIKQLTGE